MAEVKSLKENEKMQMKSSLPILGFRTRLIAACVLPCESKMLWEGVIGVIRKEPFCISFLSEAVNSARFL